MSGCSGLGAGAGSQALCSVTPWRPSRRASGPRQERRRAAGVWGRQRGCWGLWGHSGLGPCLPGPDPLCPAGQPSLTASPQTEEFFDLIASSQSRRLDDQRASVGSLPGLRITHNNLGHLRGDGDPQEPGDEFFNMLIKCQVGSATLLPPAPQAPRPRSAQGPSPGGSTQGLGPPSQGASRGTGPLAGSASASERPWVLRPMGLLLDPLSRSPQDILRPAPPYSAGAWSRAPHRVFLQPSTFGWRKPRARRHPQSAEGRRGLVDTMGCSHPPVWVGQNCRWSFRVRKPSVKWLGRGQPHSPPVQEAGRFPDVTFLPTEERKVQLWASPRSLKSSPYENPRPHARTPQAMLAPGPLTRGGPGGLGTTSSGSCSPVLSPGLVNTPRSGGLKSRPGRLPQQLARRVGRSRGQGSQLCPGADSQGGPPELALLPSCPWGL